MTSNMPCFLWKDLKWVVCHCRRPLLSSVPIEFPRKYISTVHTLVLIATTQRAAQRRHGAAQRRAARRRRRVAAATSRTTTRQNEGDLFTY